MNIRRTASYPALLPLLALVSLAPLHATSIDYIASAISPAEKFNGQSGNFRLSTPVAGGTVIQFNLTNTIVPSGRTTEYPRAVTFGVQNIGKPDGADNPAVEIHSPNFTFTSETSSHTTAVTITAPPQDGAYHVKIAATSGTGGKVGLNGSSGVVVHFIVANPSTMTDVPTSLALSLGDPCIVYRRPSVDLIAQLTVTATGAGLPGKTVTFTVDETTAGSAITDASGLARISFNSALLTAGDHTVVAAFQGAEDGNFRYLASSQSSTLGVQYTFLGFQQPINANGSSSFPGATVPVKIKIADFFGGPVADATANLFYTFGTPAVTGTESEAIGGGSADAGNTMRYDPAADQYILNWGVKSLVNGTYTLRAELGEGACAPAHTVTLSLDKK